MAHRRPRITAAKAGTDEYPRGTEHEARATAWQGFLDRTAAMVAEIGGIEIELPPRTSRLDPVLARRARHRSR